VGRRCRRLGLEEPAELGRFVSSGTFPGTIVGEGGLTKVGSGTLSLSGDNSYSGLTIMAGGQLQISGNQSSSAIRMDSGTLSGRGFVGPISGNISGIVAPGSGGADFLVALHSGSVAFNSTTTFRPLLTSTDAGYENHKLQVSGTVNLGGSTLVVDRLGALNPPVGFTFTIVDNDGSDPVAGTFAGLPEGAVFGGEGLPFRISYAGGSGNDVTITRVLATPADFSSIESLGSGRFMIQGQGVAGVEYNIQAASNLNPVINWVPLGRSTGNSSGIFQFIHSNSPAIPMRFYRAMTP